MSVAWRDTCDGFASDQRIVAQIVNKEGTLTNSDFNATAWEGRDQDFYQFHTENKINGAVVKQLSGKATRETLSADGVIEITKPQKAKQTLPDGILFPTRYTVEVLAAAQRGENIFVGGMFDGSDEHVGFKATTTIGDRKSLPASQKEEGSSDLALLESSPFWPIHVSYHDWEDQEPLPIFEMSMELHQNGVGRKIVLDYGGFAVEANLVRLQFTPRTDC